MPSLIRASIRTRPWEEATDSQLPAQRYVSGSPLVLATAEKGNCRQLPRSPNGTSSRVHAPNPIHVTLLCQFRVHCAMSGELAGSTRTHPPALWVGTHRMECQVEF